MFSALTERLAGLRQRYAEPHRAYHRQSHIDAMLSGMHSNADLIRDPATVELAIWYHDAIYDPASSGNEAQSAALLRVELAALAHPDLVQAAVRLVEASADHRLPDDVPAGLRADMALFLDLDMAVLGSTAETYDSYERGIAAEYVPVHGLAAFRHGRAAFLRTTLDRHRLFHTDRFHEASDAAARANMRRALLALDEPAG